jgi:hypothetical protein
MRRQMAHANRVAADIGKYAVRAERVNLRLCGGGGGDAIFVIIVRTET